MPSISFLHDAVAPSVSGARAWRHVAEISQHHRIQVSPGFSDAARYCREQLERAGLETELLTFAADGRATYWAARPPLSWRVRSAALDIIHPDLPAERIADFDQLPTCLIARSAPTPPGGCTTRMIAIERGDSARYYEGIDVRGCVVLARGNAADVYEQAVTRRGAAGIILDELPEFPPVRTAPDLPDATNYWMFSFTATPSVFGFSVPPRLGARLRRMAADGEVTLRAVVDSGFLPGEFEVVSGVIPGHTDEEVLLVAHLCHPCPSANDNASGSGAAIEAARALSGLIASGDLPTPQRRIRVLLVPEMTGTYAFLAQNERYRSQCLAALNLDMVGQDQSQCGSSLLVEAPPRAIGSYTAQLLAAIMERTLTGARAFSGGSGYPVCRHDLVSFSGGSDHCILSDPAVGIPCPMIIQWPDRFYHTSEDTIDKVDPEMLGRVAAASAIYLYFLASAESADAAWLAHEVSARSAQDIRAAMAADTAALTEPGSDEGTLARLMGRIDFFTGRTAADLEAILTIVPDDDRLVRLISSLADDARSAGQMAIDRARRLAEFSPGSGRDKKARPVGEAETRADGMVVRMISPGPVFLLSTDGVSEQRRREYVDWDASNRKKLRLLGHIVGYWLDGERTVSQAMDLAELETGMRDAESVVALIDWWIEFGYAELVN